MGSHILMLEMLQQLQLTVRALRQDRSAEGLHNLLDRNMLACELILGRAGRRKSIPQSRAKYRVLSGIKHTIRGQMLPCQPAGDPSTCVGVNNPFWFCCCFFAFRVSQ